MSGYRSSVVQAIATCLGGLCAPVGWIVSEKESEINNATCVPSDTDAAKNASAISNPTDTTFHAGQAK